MPPKRRGGGCGIRRPRNKQQRNDDRRSIDDRRVDIIEAPQEQEDVADMPFSSIAMADHASEIMTTIEQSRRDLANKERQQRVRNRNRRKSNEEIAAAKRKLKEKLSFWQLNLSSSESSPEPLDENEIMIDVDHEHESEQQPQPGDIDLSIVNPFIEIEDWRSFNYKIMDRACIPDGIWDDIMARLEDYQKNNRLDKD